MRLRLGVRVRVGSGADVDKLRLVQLGYLAGGLLFRFEHGVGVVLKFDRTELVRCIGGTGASACGGVGRVGFMAADLRLNLGQNNHTGLLLLRKKSLTDESLLVP